MSYRILLADGTSVEIMDERHAGETKVMIDTQGNEWMEQKAAPHVNVPYQMGVPTLKESPNASRARRKPKRPEVYGLSDEMPESLVGADAGEPEDLPEHDQPEEDPKAPQNNSS